MLDLAKRIVAKSKQIFVLNFWYLSNLLFTVVSFTPPSLNLSHPHLPSAPRRCAFPSSTPSPPTRTPAACARALPAAPERPPVAPQMLPPRPRSPSVRPPPSASAPRCAHGPTLPRGAIVRWKRRSPQRAAGRRRLRRVATPAQAGHHLAHGRRFGEEGVQDEAPQGVLLAYPF
jgi:hypothetical protein